MVWQARLCAFFCKRSWAVRSKWSHCPSSLNGWRWVIQLWNKSSACSKLELSLWQARSFISPTNTLERELELLDGERRFLNFFFGSRTSSLTTCTFMLDKALEESESVWSRVAPIEGADGTFATLWSPICTALTSPKTFNFSTYCVEPQTAQDR